MTEEIDVMHLGRDRVIAAHMVDGLIIDPGPSSTLSTLLDALDDEPRGLLLTHIHLDHAGASGLLVRRFPRLRVWVHEIGAAHLVAPDRLVRSARRLYGEDMDRLWGEVAPVPEGNLAPISGGEVVEGFRVLYTPGHASHHVAYLHETTGEVFAGDAAGVRVPPSDYTVMPTPPPDIDLEAWERSLEVIAAARPTALRLTHFGRVGAVDEHLDRVHRSLGWAREHSRDGDRDRFVRALDERLDAEAAGGPGERMRQAAPPDQLWLGLERYWRTRSQKALDSHR